LQQKQLRHEMPARPILPRLLENLRLTMDSGGSSNPVKDPWQHPHDASGEGRSHPGSRGLWPTFWRRRTGSRSRKMADKSRQEREQGGSRHYYGGDAGALCSLGGSRRSLYRFLREQELPAMNFRAVETAIRSAFSGHLVDAEKLVVCQVPHWLVHFK
jgi:hypothetical protein